MTTGTKRCPGCATALPRTSFGPDKSRRDGLAGRCRACNAKSRRPHDVARGSLGRGLHLTPEQHADRMISEALAYADANDIECAINRDHLLPLPPLCPLTLDNLVDGEDAQAPVLARLVDAEGFTSENTVILSVRAKRRHQAIGPRGLRENLSRTLDRTESVVVAEAVGRFNLLCWEADVIDGLAVDARGHLVVLPLGRRAKPDHAESDVARNWCGLISDGAPREYVAAGHRLPPERERPQPLSFNLRITKSPGEWLEWADEAPRPEKPWRIPEPKAPKYVRLSF